MKFASLFAGVGGFELGMEAAGHECVAQVEIDPAARSVLARHWPDVARFEDVREVSGRTLRELGADSLTGGFPCFPAGTLVLTRRGLVAIEDVQVGDEVLTHRNRWRTVLRHHGSHEAETVVMRGQGHYGLVTTPNHKFWAAGKKKTYPRGESGKRTTRYVPQPADWVRAENMEGQFWSSPVSFPEDKVPQPHDWRKGDHVFDLATPEVMWIAGRWLADGCTSAPATGISDKVIISCGDDEADALQYDLSRAGVEWLRYQVNTGTQFRLTNWTLAAWLTEHFGKYAHAKTVPSWIYGINEELRLAFLQGYSTGDGNTFRDGEGDAFKATTTSRHIGIGVKIVAQTLGYNTCLYLNEPEPTKEIQGRTVNQRPWYQIVARKPTAGSSAFADDGKQFALVRSVRDTGRTETVYNIEVEGDNSYIVDGLVVSNCQDLSTAGKRAGLAGNRSGLFWELTRITNEMRATWVIAENVPGLLSSNGGKDFEVVVDAMIALGYLVDVEILDAQFHGVPQRRRRVFITCLNVRDNPEPGFRESRVYRQAGRRALAEMLVGRLADVSEEFDAAVALSALPRCSAEGRRERLTLFGVESADGLAEWVSALGVQGGRLDGWDAADAGVDSRLSGSVAATSLFDLMAEPAKSGVESSWERAWRVLSGEEEVDASEKQLVAGTLVALLAALVEGDEAADGSGLRDEGDYGYWAATLVPAVDVLYGRNRDRDRQIVNALSGLPDLFVADLLGSERVDKRARLADILESGPVPERYYLSPRAAAGIIRRAERRGRALPAPLYAALAAVAAELEEGEPAEDDLVDEGLGSGGEDGTDEWESDGEEPGAGEARPKVRVTDTGERVIDGVAGTLGCAAEGAWGYDLDRNGVFVPEGELLDGDAGAVGKGEGDDLTFVGTDGSGAPVSRALNLNDIGGGDPWTKTTVVDYDKDGDEGGAPPLRDTVGALTVGSGPRSHHNGGNFTSNQAIAAGHLIPDPYPGVEGGDSGDAADEPIAILEVGARTGVSTDDVRAGMGVAEAGDPMFTLQATKQHGVYVPGDDEGGDADAWQMSVRGKRSGDGWSGYGGTDLTVAETEVAPALDTAGGADRLVVREPQGFTVHGENSGAMQSGKSDVAFPTDVTRCLDTMGGYAPNQGGNVILEPGGSDDSEDVDGD